MCQMTFPSTIHLKRMPKGPLLQTLRLQPQISKTISIIKSYFLKVGQNNFENKICTISPFKKTEKSLTRLTWLIHTLKMESVPKIKNFGLKNDVEKHFWNFSMRKPFSCNSFYLIVMRKITTSVIKMIIFPHDVLDLIDLLEQNFCQDSNLRVKLMYESVK